MKKILKFIWRACLWLFLLLLLAVLTLPLWIGPVACGIANSVMPGKLGTKFHLGQFQLNQYNGKITVGDLQVFNPPGCKQELAFTLARMKVDVDMSTVFSDTVVIEDVDIREVFVSYVSNGKGENNFDIIMRNLEGPAEAAPQTETPKARKPAPQKPVWEPAKTAAAEPSETPRKFIVDRLHVEKVLVQLGPLTIPLPPITLTGIGRVGNGGDWEAIWEDVHRQLMSNLTAAGVNLSKLGDAAGETLDRTKGAVKSMTEGASGAANSIKDGATSAANSIKDGATGAANSITDGAADALETIKGLFE